MNNLATQLMASKYRDRIFTDTQLAGLLSGNAASRYGLVNRALKDGSLLRVKRGLYTLAQTFRQKPLHPYAVAPALQPGSYISLETALSYHGWIPEQVFEIASITPGTKSLSFHHDTMGTHTFSPLAVHRLHFLQQVTRIDLHDHPVLIASPVRALMDLVALRKIAWAGLDWLEQGLRVDRHHLQSIKLKDLARLKQLYKHQKARHFLKELENTIRILKSQPKQGNLPT